VLRFITKAATGPSIEADLQWRDDGQRH
jgi:hypothetical protein